MSSFLNTSVSGLLAFQRAIDTTAHNIANVGTDGYSRQRTEFMTREASPFGNGWLGNGVEISTTRRLYDDVISTQARIASSSYGNLDSYATLMGRVNNLFSNTTTGLTPTLQKFANALQDVANNPTSSSARQVLLSEAEGFSERLKSYNAQLSELGKQIESTIAGEASEITTLSKGIAQLNQQISVAMAKTNQPPNDLLDQRDRLLDELSGHIDINTVPQGNGEINVFIGTGQPLVVGADAASLVTTTDPFDPTRHGLALKGVGGALTDVTSSISGGTLGGTMAFRSEVLDSTRNELGRIAFGLASQMNAQHRSGIDLNGQMGTDLFSVGGVEVRPANTNTGSATFNITRTDATALTTDDYILQNTSSGWTLRNNTTGATVPLAGSGTAADPFTADGLSIVVNGTAAAGDRFMIRPTAAAANGLDVLITDPGKIAAAAPIRASAASANTGTGTISAGQVVDATNPNLRTTATIQFIDATTYSVNGAGTYTYTAGSPITVNGWQVEISGAPAAGDTFTVADNTGGTGDNRNALALAESLKKPLLNDGTTSLNSATSSLVGKVGVMTRQAQSSRDAQAVIQDEALAARDSVSGVNLDEEAANLIKYQQAYQAAAQMIQVASSLFDSLLAATRR